MPTDDVDAFLMGSKVEPARFLTIGAKHEGRVLEKSMGQVRDFKTKEPKFWDNGDPVQQAIITLQTEERDPSIEDDDGRRRLYVASPNMRGAIAEAVRKTGAKKVEIGGFLGVQYTRDGEGQGGQPPKLYAAKYERPAPGDDYVEAPASHNDYSEEPF